MSAVTVASREGFFCDPLEGGLYMTLYPADLASWEGFLWLG